MKFRQVGNAGMFNRFTLPQIGLLASKRRWNANAMRMQLNVNAPKFTFRFNAIKMFVPRNRVNPFVIVATVRIEFQFQRVEIALIWIWAVIAGTIE